MNIKLRIRLSLRAEQDAQIEALQRSFAAACNALAALARETGVWSRVGLHQLGYQRMRERFPALGSQLVCNAIHSVSRACRLVYQHPGSPFADRRRRGAERPLLRFADDAPVYLDSHTLSLREGHASMYTLDGRMRFNLPLSPVDEQHFRHGRLVEVVLTRDDDGVALTLTFDDATRDAPARMGNSQLAVAAAPESSAVLPPYLSVASVAPVAGGRAEDAASVQATRS